MLNQKDIIAQNIKILNDKDISIITHDDEDYIFSALTVEGGGVFKKGIAIGIQQKMIPGLLMYDNENFFGYSEKYGLTLLSNHPEYTELELPENIFDTKEGRNILQPVQKNTSEHFQNLKETEKIENKNLNIDLQIGDSSNFYIIIPENYSAPKFVLTFDITYIYNLNSIISNLSLVIINESNKPAFFKITNKCYYGKDFNNELSQKSITKINLEIITENHFIVTTGGYSSSF